MSKGPSLVQTKQAPRLHLSISVKGLQAWASPPAVLGLRSGSVTRSLHEPEQISESPNIIFFTYKTKLKIGSILSPTPRHDYYEVLSISSGTQ